MIQLQTKDRKYTVISIDIDNLTVKLDLEQYSKLLINSASKAAHIQLVADFKRLLDCNDNFSMDIIDQQIHAIMNRYGLLVDYGMDAPINEQSEVESEEEVPY